MRLAFITPEYVTEPSYSGGLANYLGRVTAALVGRGHDVHVFTRSGERAEVEHRGVRVHRVVPLWDRRMILDHVDPLVPRSLYNPYQDLKSAWCLSRAVKRVHRRERFDLVQVANVNAVGLFIRRLRGTPLVVRMSSYRPEWDRLSGYATGLGAKARWKMEEWSVRRRPYVYAPSDYVGRQVRAAYGLSEVDVLETPFFAEEPVCDDGLYRRLAAGKRYALFFGRMTQMKGVHILAQALRGWLKRCPELQLVMVGADAVAPAGPSMKAYVREHAGEYEARVTIHDAVRHGELYPLVEHAEFVVLPSLVDNLPNTLLESMGHGKIVIGTTGSCFEQLIQDGVSGMLCEAGDAGALEEAMVRASNLESESRKRMETAARQRIAKLHPDRAVPELIEYYERVIADFHGRSPEAVQA
jgi:glycosyltransferase involved in cell wall biosynthesis